MINEHIEVVKRWQAGEEVSHEELKANAKAAWSTADRAHSEFAADDAAALAAAYAAYADATNVAHWVTQYEELTNE